MQRIKNNMKSIKTTNSISVVIALLILLISIFMICFMVIKSDIIILDKKPDCFLIGEAFLNVENNIIIENSEDAVTVAKTYIRTIYNESSSRHGPYYVYYDEELQVYYISATGKFYHAGVDMIIKKTTGEIISITHGKF